MLDNSTAMLSNDSHLAFEMLQKSRLLNTLPQELLQGLTPFLKIKRYSEQTKLLYGDAHSAEVFFLIRGTIATYSNSNLICKLRRFGDMFGDMSFITDKKCHANEIAETPVELLSLDISDIARCYNGDSEKVNWAFYQLFTAMLVDKLTMCFSKTKELHAITDKLDDLKSLLAETRLKLKTAYQAKQDFTSILRHDIRTPIYGVLGMVDLLFNSELTNQQKEFAQTIRKSATAFLEVINNVLDFSEIGSGELELQDQHFDVVKVLDKAVKELNPDLSEHDLTIPTSVAPEIPRLLKGDSVRIHQVLINLISNAIKYKGRGEVKIQVDIVNRFDNAVRLKFSVINTEIGISNTDKNRMVKSFSQLDSSLTWQYDGTGLGLVISRQLVEAMGGEIGIDSETGVGSICWFTLDLNPQKDRRVKKEPRLPQHRKPTRQSDEMPLLPPKEKINYHILLVSNDKIDQLVVQLMLEKLGYSTKVANCLEHALDYLSTHEIDAALFDAAISGKTELGCPQKSCSKSIWSADINTPVIALTSHVMDATRTKYLHGGVIDYLTKPISIEELDMVLQRWISMRSDASFNPPAQHDSGNHPCVDLNVTNRLQRDIGEIDSLINLFINEIPEKLQSIRYAISSGDCCELERAAHTLKSNCFTFGAMTMADTCYKLESMGSNGTTNGTFDLLKLLETQSTDVTAFLRNHFQIKPA